jgi:hypothetical protein
MTDTRDIQRELDDHRRKVDVDNYTITIRELLSMAENNELHRAPEYQRKFRWDEETESRLIESLLLGLPVPNIFFATNSDGTWEIVDGLQRISTLIHFASDSADQIKEVGKSDKLRLVGLRKLKSFNSLTYMDLPPAIRMSFTKRGMGVTALSDKSDPNTRFDTFERLNRGAVELSPQEVRACIYEGQLNALLRELAADPRFKGLVKLQRQNEENATREELVLKFFAYLNDRESFSGAVHDFLNTYMAANQDTADVASMRDEFDRTIDELVSVLGGGPFLRSNVSVTPQNELEAVMVAAAEVLRQHGRLGDPQGSWLDDPDLVAASTGATNTKKKLKQRISRAIQLLTPPQE